MPRRLSNAMRARSKRFSWKETDAHEPGYLTGRLSGNTLVHFKGDPSLIGTIVRVSLDEAKGFYYMGSLKETD